MPLWTAALIKWLWYHNDLWFLSLFTFKLLVNHVGSVFKISKIRTILTASTATILSVPSKISQLHYCNTHLSSSHSYSSSPSPSVDEQQSTQNSPTEHRLGYIIAPYLQVDSSACTYKNLQNSEVLATVDSLIPFSASLSLHELFFSNADLLAVWWTC